MQSIAWNACALLVLRAADRLQRRDREGNRLRPYPPLNMKEAIMRLTVPCLAAATLKVGSVHENVAART